MALLNRARKQMVILALIMQLQMLNQFTLLLMSICAVLLEDRLGMKMKKRIRYDDQSRAMIRDVNCNSIEDENLEEFDSTETQQDNYRVAEADQANGSNKQGKKRARTEHCRSQVLCEIIDRLGGYFEGIRDSIAELTSCFKHEEEHAKRKMSILGERKKVPGLTQHEWIKASMAIMKDPILIDLFMQVESDMKKQIIGEVLAHGTGN